MPRIGGHFHVDNPLAEATACGADAVQFFLGDPAGLEGARDTRRRPRSHQGRLRRRRPGHLHPRAVRHQRGDEQQPDPDSQPQAARPAAPGGRVDRGQGADRARRPRQRGRRLRRGPGELAQGGGAHRAAAAHADREHRGRRRRDGPVAGGDRPAVGGGDRGRRGRRPRTSGSAWTPATPTRPASTWPTRWTGSRRSPAGSTWCTATTHATSSAPAGTGTRTSRRGRSTRRCCSAWSGRRARRPSARRPKRTAGWPPTSAG